MVSYSNVFLSIIGLRRRLNYLIARDQKIPQIPRQVDDIDNAGASSFWIGICSVRGLLPSD
jgi:hypothetical protein